MRLAIVIPTLNEAETIGPTLVQACELAEQVVVADGGSGDDTVARARRAGVAVVPSPAGRGIQLNRGARATDAPALLFLHADTRLPPTAATQVRAALEGGVLGGGFTVRFDRGGLYALGSRLVNLRTAITGCPLGDQAQFVSRAAFERLGGFQEWPILEDLDLIRRLKRLGPTAVLPGPAITAARRFRGQGLARTVATNWLIWTLYFAGVAPHRLARFYRHVR